MSLPLKVLRVFPNPWAFIHHELGPQGAFPSDPAGRSLAIVKHVGAVLERVTPGDRADVFVGGHRVTDPRGDGTKARFRFPGLDAAMLGGTPVELPAKSDYYMDALREGSLVPADEATAKAVKCAFPDLKAAKAAGVAKFDSELGQGTWAELEKLLADAAKAPPAPTPEPTGASGGNKPGKGGNKPDGGNV